MFAGTCHSQHGKSVFFTNQSGRNTRHCGCGGTAMFSMMTMNVDLTGQVAHRDCEFLGSLFWDAIVSVRQMHIAQSILFSRGEIRLRAVYADDRLDT